MFGRMEKKQYFCKLLLYHNDKIIKIACTKKEQRMSRR